MSIDTSVGRVDGVRVSIDTSVQVSGQGSARLAGAGVKLMATHDGHDVHVSAQPAVHTPIDSDA